MRIRSIAPTAVLCAAVAALLAGSQPAAAQILGGDGRPNTGYPNFYAWYDAADGAGFFPFDGDPIDFWYDITGRFHDLIRVNASIDRWPVYHDSTAPGGHPAVWFDGDAYVWGSGDEGEFGRIETAGRTYFVVANVATSTGGYVFDSSSVAGGRNALFAAAAANPDAWWVYSGYEPALESGPFEWGAWKIHTVVLDTLPGDPNDPNHVDFAEHFINGTSVASGESRLAVMHGLILGSRYSVSGFMTGSIAEMLVYDTRLGDADRAAVEGYLIDKYFAGNIPPSLLITEENIQLDLTPGTSQYAVAEVSDPETPTANLVVWVSGGNTSGLSAMVDSVDPDTGVVTIEIQQSAGLATGLYPIELSATDGTHTVAKSINLRISSGVLAGDEPDPAYPGFYAWYDAGEGVNGAGTPTDGSPVISWQDLTGNLRDLTRVDADPNRQAVFAAGAANGQNAVQFDGNDYIWANGSNEFGTIATPGRTYFAVVRVDAATSGYVFDSSSSGGRNALFAGQNANPNAWWLYSGTTVVESVDFDLGVWHIHAVTFDQLAQQAAHYIDGQPVVTGEADLATMNGLLLGSRYSLTNGLAGAIAELLVYDEVLADADRQAIEGYLIGKYLPGGLPPAITITQDPVTVPLAEGTTSHTVAEVSDPDTSTGALTVSAAGGDAGLTVTVSSVDPNTGMVVVDVEQTAAAAQGSYPIELSVSDGVTTVSRGFTLRVVGDVLAGGLPDTSYPFIWAWFDAGNLNRGDPNLPDPNDGEVVTYWADLAPAAHDLPRIFANPLLDTSAADGLPAVVFNGDDGIWGARSTSEFGWMTGSGRTFFVVARVDAKTSAYLFDGSSFSGRNALIAGISPDPNDPNAPADPDSWWLYSGSGSPTPTAAIVPGELQVHSVVMDVAGSAEWHYINGALAGFGDQPVASHAGLILGMAVDATHPLQGAIAEVLVYDQALAASDRSAVEGYLLDKYGLVGPGLKGDLNCDGVVNADDMQPFLLALTDAAAYAAAYPGCDINHADLNDDGSVNLADLTALFDQCLAGPQTPYAAGCGLADQSQDGDVDLEDAAMIQVLLE